MFAFCFCDFFPQLKLEGGMYFYAVGSSRLKGPARSVSSISARNGCKGILPSTLSDLTRVKLVPPSDRMLAAMGKVMKVTGTNAIRFSRNIINGVYVDDALIYRLAA